jgi:YgiT-type zinc finger domain-containing protein
MVSEAVRTGWGRLGEEVWLGVAEWRAAHPKATFSEIEQAVEEQMARIRTRVMADVALATATSDIAALPEDARPSCPECGGSLEARGKRTREVLTLRGDTVSLPRSYTVCRACGQGLFPPR